MEIVRSLAGDRFVLSGVTFSGIVLTMLGAYYLASAIHGAKVGRLVSLASVTVLSGFAYSTVFYLNLHREIVDGLIGLALGIGLGFGLGVWFPIRIRIRPVSIALNVGQAITYAAIYVVLGVPFTVLILPGYVFAFLVWGVLWLVTFPLMKILSAIGRQSVTLDSIVIGVFGSPARRSSMFYLFSAIVPSSPTAQWLFYGVFGVSLYLLTLIVGHVAVLGALHFLALDTTSSLESSLVPAIGFGLACGYVLFAPTSMVAYSMGLQSEDNGLLQSIQKDEAPTLANVREALANDKFGTAASEFVGMSARGTQLTVDNVLDRNVPQEGYSEKQISDARAVVRTAVAYASGLNIGLMNALILGAILSVQVISNLGLAQRAIVLVFAYLLGLAIARFNALWAGIVSLLVIALGVAMQTVQYWAPVH